MPMDAQDIARSFLDWGPEEVTKWLSTLSLTHDYSQQFQDCHITGVTLINLNPAALDQLKITEGADRVKILQQLTTMRADLIIDSPSRRVRSPSKMRRFSDTYSRASHSPTKLNRYKNSISSMDRTLPPAKRVITPVSPKYSEGLSPDSLSIESPASSGVSSPIKLRSRATSPHELVERRGRDFVNKLQTTATIRGHNLRRLSRSLDGLFQDGEDIFSLVAKADPQENCNSRLVEILREENTSLKKDLETYYQRVRKLQKLEQEIEHIREGQRMLEASNVRREKLEGALRAKLEKQVRSLRAEIVHLKAELVRTKKPDKNEPRNDESPTSSRSREIRRRDTMIMKLIKQNHDSVAAREALEKDLHSTRLQLQTERMVDREGSGDKTNDFTENHIDTENKMSHLYTKSIDKLKSVLATMHSMSAKRERLETDLRTQLLAEIARLKTGSNGTNGIKESKGELLVQVATLKSDLLKWEQKCLELVAEKEMVLEAAVVPRDSRMEHLQQTLSEQALTIQELNQQRSSYINQLTDTHKRLAELETKVSSLRVAVNEKEAVIQALQNSFLEPDDLGPDDHMFNGSGVLHHSPVSARKLGFPPNGSQLDIDGTVSLPGDVPLGYPAYPSSPKRQRGIPNGQHSRGHLNEPYRRYSEKASPVGPRSVSPVKRAPPVYMMKDPPPYGTTDYSAPNTHYNKPNFPCSNSTPSTPNTRGPGRKPRISHPNMHFLHVQSPKSPTPPSQRKFPLETMGRPSPGQSETRRNTTKPPMSPSTGDRQVKSKTPPPNYKLVSTAKNSPQLMSKQRHHSVDDVLKEGQPQLKPAKQDSEDLFNSLLAGNPPPTQPKTPPKWDGHRHSKSSPSSERRTCFAYAS